MSSRPPAPFTAAKLLWDPELNPSCRTLLYRVDGIVEGRNEPDPDPVVDPRRPLHFRNLCKKPVIDLPIPCFKIDAYYVGEKPEKEITFSNLNDNITFKNLEEMCRHFGTIVEAKIYYHPKTQRHLGIGTVVFTSSKSARTCVEHLNQTSKMGNIMTVQVDPFGKIRARLIAEQMADLIPLKQNDQQFSDKHFTNSTCAQKPPSLSSHGSSVYHHTSYDPHLNQPHSYSNLGGHAIVPESLSQTHYMTSSKSHIFSKSVDKQELEFRTYSHSKKSVHALNNNDITDIPHMSTRVQREISDISNPQEKSTYDVITDRMQTSEVNTVAHKTSCNNQDDAKVQKLRQCEESLEARIQKLLRLNPVQSTSELKDAQHCPVVSDTSCKVTGNLPTTSETYQSTNVHDKLDDIKQSEGPSKMLIQKGNTHSESSKNTQIVTSPSSNRRTLLPTPEVSSENIKGPLFSLHRPPLLKTPYKPCNIQEVVKIIEDVHIVFINELRSIIQRDMTRKLVEGQAFKLFSDWWDSKDRECKNHTKPLLSANNVHQTKDDVCTNPTDKSNTSHDTAILSRIDQKGQTNQSIFPPVSNAVPNNSAPNISDSSLSSNFKLFGLGMFTGLRSALPKIRRKPRPPTPPSPSANTSASPSKNKSPTFQNNHDINSPRECDTKPTRSPVWKSCQSRTRKGSETSWSDEDNDYVITRCRKLSGSSGSESSTERSKQTPNIRVEKSRKSNERHYERHSESSDVDEKCKYKQSPSKVSFKCSQSPANVHTSDYTSSSSSSSNSDNDDESIQPKKTLPRRAAVPVSDVFTKSSASSTGSSSLSSGDDDNDDESSGPSTEPQNDPEEANRYKKYPSDVLSDLSDISDLSDSKSSIHNRLSPVESFHSEPTQNDKSSGDDDIHSSPNSSQSESALEESDDNEAKLCETSTENQRSQDDTIFQKSPVSKPMQLASEDRRKPGRPRKSKEQSVNNLSHLSPQKTTCNLTGSLDSANSSSDDDLLQMNNSTSVDFPVHNRIPTKPNQLNCQSRPDWSILRASLELPPPDYTKSLTHDYQLSAISRRKQNLGNLYRNDNNYASVTEQRNKPPESDSSSKFSLISDQKVNKYPPYQSPRLPLSSITEDCDDLEVPIKRMNTASNYYHDGETLKLENLNDENAQSDSTESVEIEETIKNKYAWPNFLLIEHSYFHVPDIGSVIRYRSTKRVTKPKSITKDAESTEFFANSHFTSAENLRKRSWHADSPEDNCDTRDNDPNAYSSAWFNMSKRLNMSESLVKDEEQLQDCKPYLKSDKFSREENRTPKNAETKSKTVKVRGSRELASLLEPVDKSEIRRFVTNSHDTEKDDIHKHLSGERVTSKSRVHFEPRSASEEDYILRSVLHLGMDAEDLGFLCEAYQILLNKCRSPSDTVSYPDSERNNFPMNTAVTDPHVATLVNLSHWIEHPPTLIPDPITVKSYINDNGRLVTSHHLSSRRQKSVRQRHHNKGSRSKHSVSKQSSVRQRSYARSSDSNDVYSSLSDQSVDHSPGEHNVNDLANRPICKNEGSQSYLTSVPQRMSRRSWPKFDDQIIAVAKFTASLNDSVDTVKDNVDIHLGPAACLPPIHSSGNFFLITFTIGKILVSVCIMYAYKLLQTINNFESSKILYFS
uniref:RRM domain-containing protein n=1 Tax=Trichobilharzia regenti TaxID=157069 RepID=A0AA85JAI2_TRIRE|nr:unnamed protein product [Trichobilharzia regenti]